eukprot:TRINITY_DN38840_c0_g1_i2.p1 TRINITY_DN38840_c0_g1~~TRINITY_DN38840_c0_g1_i2.p1  ORF type:complete len:835 (+),score=31.53 TRINITY_DN38840_c0_g1_i2:158-2662(+)
MSLSGLARSIVEKYAHPSLVQAASSCPADYGVQRVIQKLVNDSGHLHWRYERLRWLAGDVFVGSTFPESLRALADDKLEDIQWRKCSNPCAARLALAAEFYLAWIVMYSALEMQGQHKREDDAMHRIFPALFTHYREYLFLKPANEPLFLQEAQFATFSHMVRAVLSGVHSHCCVCLFSNRDFLFVSSQHFQRFFRHDHIRPGPSNDPERDALLKAHRTQDYTGCNWNDHPAYQQFFPDAPHLSQLFMPDPDQIRSNAGCYPWRILSALVCAQCAMLYGETVVAMGYFEAVQFLLLLSVDCFDSATEVHREASRAPTALDIFAYMGRLDVSVAPARVLSPCARFYSPWPKIQPQGDLRFSDWTRSVPVDGAFVNPGGPLRKAMSSRAMALDRMKRTASLPSLCLSHTGQLSLLTNGLANKQYYIFDWTEPISLVPVTTMTPSATRSSSERAIIVRVDVQSWSNLGHAFMFLIPLLASVYKSLYERKGLEAVWHQRHQHRLYIRMPRDLAKRLRDKPKACAICQWFSLLSSQPATIVPLLTSDASVDHDVLPDGVILADKDSATCHFANTWVGATPPQGARRDDVTFFVKMAQSFPPWQVENGPLLHRVWGLHDSPSESDPCILPGSSCLRVLAVQRGAGVALNARRVHNLDQAIAWIGEHYATDVVRTATVQMEQFSIAEEIALARHTDVLIGAFGSGMWWGIFLPENACIIWLYPHLYLPGLKTHRDLRYSGEVGKVPLWHRRSYLEYSDLRKLWHVQIFGQPASGDLPGRFSSSPSEETDNGMSYMDLDVIIDLGRFEAAFRGVVRVLTKGFWRPSRRDSRQPYVKNLSRYA